MSTDNISKHIEEFGWHFLFVFDPEGEKADFAYSIGFEESFNHPEILIFGLNRDTAHGIMSDIAKEVRAGRTFETEKKLNDVIGGNLDVIFKPIIESAFDDYLGMAVDFYDKPFRANILFWPDKSNTLPTESGCELTLQNEALAIV